MEKSQDTSIKFEQMVLPQLEILYKTAWLHTRNQIDAEDLVQETLEKAYKAIDRFDGRYPRAWLLTILKNTHINRGRKKKPELLKDPDIAYEHSDQFADQNTPETKIVDPTFSAEVETAFNKLGQLYKEVLVMVDVSGQSYQEAADALDVPVGTVMSRLHRARKQIKDELPQSVKEAATRRSAK